MNIEELLNWMEFELECGSRVKASKLYKLFYKYAQLRYPNVNENELNNYRNYYWNVSASRPKPYTRLETPPPPPTPIKPVTIAENFDFRHLKK